VDTQDGRHVVGGGQSLTRPDIAVGNVATDLGGHLVMKSHGVVPIDLDSAHGDNHSVIIVSDTKTSLKEVPTLDLVDHDLVIREARRRQRRRWLALGAVIVVVACAATAIVGLTSGAFGGTGPPKTTEGGSRPFGPAATSHPSAQTVAPGNGVVGRGPTAIDFLDPQHGWVASGGNLGLETYNPTVIRTSNGGSTWTRAPVPNLAAQPVDWQTNRTLGGVVGINFAGLSRGWFYQDGIAWQTNDAATKWTKISFPNQGGVVALTSLGDNVWALVDSCPIHAVSCPQDLAKGTLYHAISNRTLRWRSVGGALPGGFGELYPGAGQAVVVAVGSSDYRRSASGRPSENESGSCEPIGPLSGGALAGLCGGDGGGNASDSTISASKNAAVTWQTLVGGPPSTGYEGSLSTNGSDTVFYVTGGQTLWRTSTTDPEWRPVLQAPSNSTEEIYPVFVSGDHGYALEGDGKTPHWFETNDDGISWQPATLP
jgi:hypothetical protein